MNAKSMHVWLNHQQRGGGVFTFWTGFINNEFICLFQVDSGVKMTSSVDIVFLKAKHQIEKKTVAFKQKDIFMHIPTHFASTSIEYVSK